MKKSLIKLLALLIIVTGCAKEEIITVTKITGNVIEKSTDAPLPGIKVSVTNGQRELVKTNTDTEGCFELDVDFDKVTANDSLLLDGSPNLPSKKFELKGMGKPEYNYGTLWLYDKSDNNQLPQVTTDSVLNVGSTTAEIAGTIMSDGGFPLIERGICFAIHQTPTVDDSIRKAGAEIGEFSCQLTNLELNTVYYARAYATNSIGTNYGEQISFTTVSGLAEVVTNEASEVTALSAVLGGNVIDDGGYAILKRGVCYGQVQLPSFADNVKEAGGINGTGEFECEVGGLTPTTDYYFRAFAINAIDTVFGGIKSFRTTDGKPVVVTATATNVTEISAILGGEVTSDGGYAVTQRGVCYATHANPSLTDYVKLAGEGTGEFSCSIDNLTPEARYYYRAFAINEISTVFGQEKNFKAVNGMPTVSTLNVTNILPTSATAGGIVTDDAGHNVTERGVCWSTEHNPNPDNNAHAVGGSGLGSFTVQMTGLNPSTRYYVKAYAKNSEGTSVGNEVYFDTPDISTPTVTTQSITEITRTTAMGGGIVTSDGGAFVTERGICWSTSPNPTISNSHATNGTGEGSFSVLMTGLTPNTLYYVKAYAINSQGVGYGEEKTFRTVNISIPLVTTTPVTNITQTTAVSGGNVTDNGGGEVTERGVCWSLSENPTIDDSHASNGTGSGIYTVSMTGLLPGKTYHVRAYAKNSVDTGYGDDLTFETLPIQKPTVATSNITNISYTTATGGGNVTADGGSSVTERGICWSTSPNPTISDSHAYSGMGLGNYTVEMTGLAPGTSYYVRAYAKNSEKTGYGQDVVFTTLSVGEPSVTTLDVTDISQNTAICGGNVTADGGSAIIERGLCWGVNPNPTISGSHLSSGAGLGQFTLQMTGLASNTTYYVRAYAKNNEKTGYGEDKTFTTLAPLPPTGAIAGLFTINNSGDKVYFSQGNLQYRASTDTWRFAENQWDYAGADNANISETYSGWIDLFGWGTSGYHNPYDNFNVNYQPWATSTATVNTECNYYGYGPSTNMPDPNLTGTSANYDWGVYNPISNGGNQSGLWRTLTTNEWDYVFNTRQASTVGGTANARYAKAMVNEKAGVILFPDNYTHPSYLPSPLQVNINNAPFNINSYSGDGWAAMEELGCVFLPAAGYRYGVVVHNVNSSGSYWSVSYYDSGYAFEMSFGSGGLLSGPGIRRDGYSVRLVQDY